MTEGKILIGTSGWHYDHWRGSFYPESLPKREWLSYYARQFPCVELNNSFYRLPKTETIATWVEQTPAPFTFIVKASRLITHMKKLRECEAVFANFNKVMKSFGRKLGPVLFQLPPHWSVNLERLQEFLSVLPARQHFAFEFRDPSWCCDEVYRLLDRHNVATCHSDFDGIEFPDVVTADFVYVRLHGPTGDYRGSYSHSKLKALAGRISQWRLQKKIIYVFFNNDEAGYAAANAAQLLHLCHEYGTAHNIQS